MWWLSSGTPARPACWIIPMVSKAEQLVSPQWHTLMVRFLIMLKILVQIPWLFGGKWSKYNGLMEFRVSLKIEVSTWNSTCMNFQHGTQCIFQKSFQTQDRPGQESTSSETDWNGVYVPYWAQWGKMVVKMRHLEDRITFLKAKVFAWGFDIIFSTSMLRNNSIFRISF